MNASSAVETDMPRDSATPRFSIDKGLGAAAVAPSVLLIGALFVLPILGLIVQSFTDPEPSLKHYAAVVQDPALWRIIWKTLWLGALCTLLCLVLGYPFAYLLASVKPRAAVFLMLFVLIPFWTSVLVRLYAWMVILGRQGVINSVLQHLGLIDQPLPLLYNSFAVAIGMTHWLLPYMILPLYATMKSIDKSYIEASRTMGASDLRTFWNVYLPLSFPGVAAGSLLVFILALGFYVTPALLGGPKDTLIAVYIQQQVGFLNWGEATAMATLLLVIVLALLLVYDRVLGMRRMFENVGK